MFSNNPSPSYLLSPSYLFYTPPTWEEDFHFTSRLFDTTTWRYRLKCLCKYENSIGTVLLDTGLVQDDAEQKKLMESNISRTQNKQSEFNQELSGDDTGKIIGGSSKISIVEKRVRKLLKQHTNGMTMSSNSTDLFIQRDNKQYKYTCNVCHKTFSQLGSLKMHYLIHTGEKPFKCLVCGKGFTQYGNMKVHIEIHNRPFQCELCNKGFTQQQRLQKHQLVHTRGNNSCVGTKISHVCTECGKTFQNRSQLQRHEQTHTGEKPHKCETCGRTYSDKAYWKKHVSKQMCGIRYTCDNCNSEFMSEPHLNRHKRRNQCRKEGTFICNSCHEPFETRITLESHKAGCKKKQISTKCNGKKIVVKKEDEKNSRKEELYVCSFCEKQFEANDVLKAHESICPKKRNLFCDICYEEFACQRALKLHKTQCQDMKTLCCPICCKEFDNKELLKTHKELSLCDGPLCCTFCYEEFESKEEFDVHEAVCQNILQLYTCKYCGKEFERKKLLEAHKAPCQVITSHNCLHRNERFENKNVWKSSKVNGKCFYKCKLCDEKCEGKSDLKSCIVTLTKVGAKQNKQNIDKDVINTKKYEQTVHKDFKCTDCGKMFNTIWNLRIHSRVHSGEKPYKCDICGKSFTQSSSLKTHSVIHVGEQSHECSVCGKMFMYVGNLRTHLRIHSGEKPYCCPYDKCKKTYTQSSSLNTHIANSH